jgi:sulfatase modifying factor 1
MLLAEAVSAMDQRLSLQAMKSNAVHTLIALIALPLFFTARQTPAVTIDMVTVGNTGNPSHYLTGYGAVAREYRIGKYEVTIGQYTDFLNAVASTDTHSLYNANMGTNLNVAGIARTGLSGAYSYSIMNNDGFSGNRPITYVSWFDAARFANWMSNGQPTGEQNATTTENGAYLISGTVAASAKNAVNPNTGLPPIYFIPTENEWYKAAYYRYPGWNNPSGTDYFAYATQSNTDPGNIVSSLPNQANFYDGDYAVKPWLSYSATRNYLTDVGVFTSSGSFYGTFDQNGNVGEWNDLSGTANTSRGIRGGHWNTSSSFLLSAESRGTGIPSFEGNMVGFRLAAPVAVPEPSTWLMGLMAIACGGWIAWRKRKRSAADGSLVTAASCIALAFAIAGPAHAEITWTNYTTESGLASNMVFGVHASGNAIYAATYGGLSVSSDNGANWTTYTTANGLGRNWVYKVYTVGSTIYAATYGGGLSVSPDHGANWTTYTTANGLGNYVIDVYVTGSTIYAAADGGLSVSTDHGAHWTDYRFYNGFSPVGVIGVYASGSTIYVGTGGGLRISPDHGINWTTYTTANGLASDAVEGVYADGRTIYAATSSPSYRAGLSVSPDDGANWISYSTDNGLASNSQYGLYVFDVYADGSTIYAATDGGLSLSPDNGASWTTFTTASGLAGPDVQDIYVAGGKIYAATGGGLSVGVVPEPSTWLMGLAGLAYALTLRRSRRAA